MMKYQHYPLNLRKFNHPTIVLLISIVMFSCQETEPKDEGLPLPVMTLQEEKAAKSFQYLGSIEGVENVAIRPQVDGILEEIYVDEGVFVKKGQPLYELLCFTKDQHFPSMTTISSQDSGLVFDVSLNESVNEGEYILSIL